MTERQEHILRHVEEVHNKYHRLVAQAWDDPEFKERLIADPDRVFHEQGITIPAGVRVRVHENTSGAWNFVLPARLAELSDDTLHAVELADDCVCTCCCGYTLELEAQLSQLPAAGE